MNSDRFFGHSEGAGGRNQRKPLFKRILVAGISSAMTLGLLVGGVTVSPAWGEEMNSASAPSSVSASTTAETLGGVLDSADSNSIENGESDGAGTPQPQEPEITVPETPTDPQPETPSTGTDPAPEGEGSEDTDVETPQTDIEKEAVPQADESGESENIAEQEEEDIEELATGVGYNWTTESNYRSVMVQATGERSNTTAAVTPLNGAVYVAVRSQSNTPPAAPSSLNDSYFYCTTGLQQGTLPREDGKCVIRIPDSSSNNANNDNNRYWIVEYSAPAPYEILTSVAVGGGSTFNANTYAFRIAGRGNNRNFTVPYQDGAINVSDGTSNSENRRVTSGWWPHVRTNPQFPKQCLGSSAMKIALILDTSGSMANSMGALRDAAKAFVGTDALGLTDTNISLYRFASEASQLLGSTSIRTQAGINTVTASIDTLQTASGGTNWDHALRIVPAGQWDAVIMLTDGNPTFRRVDANSSTAGDGNTTSLANVENAIVAANRLKNLGTAVWAVGIGMPANSRANLNAIAHSDNVYLTVSSELKATLKDIATKAQCQASVTVKKVVEEDGVTSPAAGWDMTTALSNKVAGTSGTPDLLIKSDDGTWGTTNDTSTLTTDSDGLSEWRIQFKNPEGTTTKVVVNETDQAGYEYQSVLVTKNSLTVTSGKEVNLEAIKPGDIIEIVYNNKKVVPKDGLVSWQKLDGTDESLLGDSTWRIKNSAGTVIKTVADNSDEDLDKDDGKFQVRLNLGTYTIEETVAPDGYDLITTQIEPFSLTADNAEQGITIGSFINTRKTGTVTWKKINPEGTPLPGSEWTITPIDPEGAAFDVADNTGQEGYSGRDTDDAPGLFKVEDLAWGSYTLVEKTAPENYDPDTEPHPFTIGRYALNYEFEEGIVNNPIRGTVSWSKVDENDDLLGDTEWTITPIDPAGTVLTITDCTPEETCSGEDKDSAVGQFTVVDLPVGTYELRETKTKDGYILDTNSYEFSITASARNYVFEDDFVNKPPIIPNLPLTGGIGSDGYLIGGTVALLLTVVAVAGTQMKRRRDAHASL